MTIFYANTLGFSFTFIDFVLCLAGDDNSPSKWQSASKIVKSFSEPKNFVDSSKSLMRNLTRAPRT